MRHMIRHGAAPAATSSSTTQQLYILHWYILPPSSKRSQFTWQIETPVSATGISEASSLKPCLPCRILIQYLLFLYSNNTFPPSEHSESRHRAASGVDMGSKKSANKAFARKMARNVATSGTGSAQRLAGARFVEAEPLPQPQAVASAAATAPWAPMSTVHGGEGEELEESDRAAQLRTSGASDA